MPVPMRSCPYPPIPSNLPCFLHQPPPRSHWEDTVYHLVVRDSTPGLVPVALSPPALPLQFAHPFRMSQGKVLEPLGRDRENNHKRNT